MTTLALPISTPHDVSVTPIHNRFAAMLDPLAGTPVRMHRFTWEQQPYLLAAFAPRFTSQDIVHPLPVLSGEERQRLLLQQHVIVYRLLGDLTDSHGYAALTHKVLQVTTYFGSDQAVLAVPTTALLIRDHALLHYCIDVLEHWLVWHHGLMEFLAPPYHGGSSEMVRQFWYARGYRPDPLIPARLVKGVPERNHFPFHEIQPLWPGASPAWPAPRSLPL